MTRALIGFAMICVGCLGYPVTALGFRLEGGVFFALIAFAGLVLLLTGWIP